MTERVTARGVEGFVQRFLLEHYADVHPVEWFHRAWWEDCCSADRKVAIAAPRGHSKSTSINIAYSLATALLEQHPFQIKVSRSRPIAIEFLRTVKEIIANNREIAKTFRFRKFIRDTEDDFIASFGNGYQIRMVAMGVEQSMRGFTWDTKRASLIIGDDMEDDEQVLSADRRDKTLYWFMNTLRPLGSDDAQFRVIGTVLHEDSLLSKLLKNEEWKHSIYEGCNEDLTELLWPQKFPLPWWQAQKREAISFGNLVGFNMEYRNIAMDTSSGFFQKQDFRPMEDDDHDKTGIYYVGGDLAISTDERRDRTAFVIAKIDSEGFLYVVDIRAGRWDAKQIGDEIFSIEETYHPEEWYIEEEKIKKSMSYGLELEMRARGVYPNLVHGLVPTKNKMARARAIQARMRARSVLFNIEHDLYQPLQNEMLAFDRSDHDDFVDAMAWLGIGLSRMVTPLSDEDAAEEAFVRAETEEDVADENSYFGIGN